MRDLVSQEPVPLLSLHPAPAESDGEVTAEALHERYLDAVFAYVSRRVPGREEAEDLCAEVFAAAFAALPRFRGRCSPYLWLLGIARRKVADALRRRASRRESLASELEAVDGCDGLEALPWTGEGPEAAALQGETRRKVRELLDELKEEQREALLLRYVEGLTIAEISVVMGRSPAAVNSLLQRARAALLKRGRAYFGEDGP